MSSFPSSTDPKIEFRKIRTVYETINIAAEFIHQNFFSLLKSLVYTAFPFILFAFLSNTLFAFLTLGFDFGNWEAIENLSVGFGTTLLLFFVLLVVGLVMFVATIFEYMIVYHEKEDITDIKVGEVSKRVFKDLWMFISTTLGLTTIFILGLIPMILVLIIPFAGILLFYGLIFYIAMIFPMVYIMRAVERNGLFNAISRSRQLIEGQFWPTVGLLFLTNMITTCLSFVPSMLVIGLTVALATLGLNFLSVLIIALQIFLSIIYLLANTLFLLVIGFRYFSLVELKEGVGTIQKINLIGQDLD